MGAYGTPRAKKGAHYSALKGLGTRRARAGSAALAAALMLAALGSAAAPPAAATHPETDARKAEEQLQAVKSEIERVTREVSAEQVERDRLTRELRASELSVGKAREALGDLRR
jgi:septal ring factor EnvC (AmiA/AmiB activator)